MKKDNRGIIISDLRKEQTGGWDREKCVHRLNTGKRLQLKTHRKELHRRLPSILLHECGVKASKPLLAKKNQVSPLP